MKLSLSDISLVLAIHRFGMNRRWEKKNFTILISKKESLQMEMFLRIYKNCEGFLPGYQLESNESIISIINGIVLKRCVFDQIVIDTPWLFATFESLEST